MYDLSMQRTAGAVLLILIPVIIALAIVYWQAVDPDILSYFADALNLTTLGVIIFVSVFLGVKWKRKR